MGGPLEGQGQAAYPAREPEGPASTSGSKRRQREAHRWIFIQKQLAGHSWGALL